MTTRAQRRRARFGRTTRHGLTPGDWAEVVGFLALPAITLAYALFVPVGFAAIVLGLTDMGPSSLSVWDWLFMVLVWPVVPGVLALAWYRLLKGRRRWPLIGGVTVALSAPFLLAYSWMFFSAR